MASLIGVCCDAEGKDMWMRKVGKYLAIQIWSPNMAKDISKNVSILNGGIYFRCEIIKSISYFCHIVLSISKY